jgi:DNA-binding transcriptional ArsR family regulator
MKAGNVGDHPVRAEILAVLEKKGRSREELRRELIEQPDLLSLNYHLGVLESAGLIVWDGGIYLASAT